MKSRIYFIGLVCILFGITGCSRQASETIIASIGDQPLTLTEYEATYARLNGGWDKGKEASIDDRKEFLDLLVRYKLKMKDAYAEGLDRSPEVLEELGEYEKSLAVAFLLEREFFEPAYRAMYERKKYEIRASHILLRLGSNPSPADTLAAYERALGLIQKLDAGASFEDLAVEHSEDPSAAQNRGDLYFFTGGLMVKSFEDAVFALQPGEMTRTPVRTQYGYHIIKKTDRRPSTGGVRASHIMKYALGDADPADTLKALESIQAILDTLRTGADFAEMAQRHSEDWGSSDKGGDLGVFQRRRLPKEFEEVAFDQKAGEISGVVRTQYGFHIIKTVEHVPLPSYADMREELRKTYQQSRLDTEYAAYMDSLRRKYAFESHPENIESFLASLDTASFTDTEDWIDELPGDMRKTTLYTIAGNPVGVERIAKHLSTNPEFIGRRLQPSVIRGLMSRIEEIELLHEEAKDIPRRHPDFTEKIQEYKDGILIYYIEQQKVWSALDLSEENLRTYYEATTGNYTYPDRVNLIEISVRQDTLAQSIYNRIIAGEDMEELAAQYTIRPGMKRNRGVTGMIEATKDDFSARAFSQEAGDVSEPFRVGSNYAIVKTIEKDPARHKTFEEARAQVTTAYQDEMAAKREQEWLDGLKQRFPVSIHYDYLEQAFADSKE